MGVEEFLEVVLGLPEVVQHDGHPALAAEAPGVFSVSWTSGRFGWVNVRLEKVDRDELVELVTEGWRLSAPKRLAASYMAGTPGDPRVV